MFRRLKAERDRRFRAEFLVVHVADHRAKALRKIAEEQRVVRVSLDWKEPLAINLSPRGGEMRRQILFFQRIDLRNGLAFTADDPEIRLAHPERSLKEPLPG